MITAGEAEVPAEFMHALKSVGGQRLRPEVSIREVPAPGRVAPFSMAITGEILAPSSDIELASGRFILLHDPAGQESWHGRFRVVTLVRATLEPEMAADPLLAEVAWTWFEDALQQAGAEASAEGGTVTRVLSQRFGALAGQSDDVELEIRASWTPDTTDLGVHLDAWATLLCTAAGLPPLPDGVTSLQSRRNTVGP